MLRTNPSLLAKPDKEHVLLLMPFFAEASSRLGHSATRWRFSSNYFKCLGDYLFLLKHKNGIPISKETLSLEWAKYLKAVPLQFWAFVHLFASLVNLYKRGFEITFLLQLLCLVFIFNLNNSGWKLQTINPKLQMLLKLIAARPCWPTPAAVTACSNVTTDPEVTTVKQLHSWLCDDNNKPMTSEILKKLQCHT